MKRAPVDLANAERPAGDRPETRRDADDPARGYWHGSATGEVQRWRDRALSAERQLAELRADVALAGSRAMASVHRPALEAVETEQTEAPASSSRRRRCEGRNWIPDPVDRVREPSKQLGVWREHDERDRPLAGNIALVFIGADHPPCVAEMEKHPRLYDEVQGSPGHFPLLCGSCVHRDGWACRHAALKANGGAGLRVDLSPGLPGMILCSRGRGCHTPLRRAMSCVGQRLQGEQQEENRP